MGQVVHATIEGLAGRSDIIAISFHPDLNVFWGPNGTGKTSLLKILHSAMTGNATSLTRVPFREARVVLRANNGQEYTRSIRKYASRKAAQQEIEFTQTPPQYELTEPEFPEPSKSLAWKTVPDRDSRLPFSHGYLPISRMTDAARGGYLAGQARELSGVVNEALLDQAFARQTMAIWRDYSNQALIKIRRAQEHGMAEVLSAILAGEGPSRRRPATSGMPSEQAYGLVKSFFSGQRINPQLSSAERFAKNYEGNRLLQDVVARIAEVDHQIQEAQLPQRRLENLLKSLFPKPKEVIFDARGLMVHIGKETIPLESLSSGEKQIIRLLLECLAASTNCILIDEPEISLHVDWQHRLVDSMRAVNLDVQIILATHSPEVMAELSESRLIEL